MFSKKRKQKNKDSYTSKINFPLYLISVKRKIEENPRQYMYSNLFSVYFAIARASKDINTDVHTPATL